MTDRQDERDEEKHALEDRVANAEAEARAQKERADAAVAAAASAPRLTVEAGRANGEVDPARQEREKSLEAEVKSARENKARDKETISQLEARILAYEANGGFCFSLPSQLLSPVGLPFDAPRMLTFQLCAASRLERSPSRASWGGVGLTVTSGFSQGVVDRFTSTITDLNQQVSELRDENSASPPLTRHLGLFKVASAALMHLALRKRSDPAAPAGWCGRVRECGRTAVVASRARARQAVRRRCPFVQSSAGLRVF